MKNKIIKGYHGIMDLDLTHVDIKYHNEMIKQHNKDIELYKIEQDKLKPKDRYENTILRVQNQQRYEDYIIKMRKQKEIDLENRRHRLLNEIYEKNKKK